MIRDGTKTTTINDNFRDKPEYPNSYALSAAPTTLGEGDEATQITFTATLPGKSVFPLPVDIIVYVSSDSRTKGTAGLAEDYTVSGSHGNVLVFSIPASSSSATGTLDLDPVDDSQVEGDETVVFASLGAGGLTTTDRPTITITDNDDGPASITLSASPPVLREGSKAEHDVTVTATLDGGGTLSTPTTVAVSLADGAAVAGSDYSAASATVTIAEGESSGSTTLKVKIFDDKTVEEAEDLSVTGTAQGFTVSPADLIILDDDGTATGIMLHVSPSRVREDAGATDLTVTVAFRSGTAVTNGTVIDLSLADGTATLASDDYSAATGTVTIPAGQFYGTGTFTFTPKTDAIVEPDETVLLNGSTKDLTVTPATITIINSNEADLSIGGPSGQVAEGANATFTVTLSAKIAKEVTVAWSAPLSTDAAESADLGTTSGTVTFAANSAAGATQNITITATDDALSEPDESFTVTLGTVGGDLSSQVTVKSGASNSDTATIAESDPITISISGPSNVDEGDATSSYTVSLSGGTPTADLTVSYATADGTAVAGTDYTAKSGTLTFTQADHADKTFTVQTTEDTVAESGETFTVTISSPSGGGGPTPSLGTASVITTTIDDDDDASTGITLSASPSSLGEDDSATSVTVTATLNGSTRTEATVVTIGTLSGTATAGTGKDYTATSLASITIPANTMSGTGTITITPIDDAVVEGE